MSYDAYLTADLGGPSPTSVGNLEWNYTFNIRPMLEKAGLPSLVHLDGVKASVAALALEAIVLRMKSCPDEYRALNPENGWGDFDSFVDKLLELHAACACAPLATLRISA